MKLAQWLKLQWDRAAAWLCVGAGAVTLILGWVGVSGTDRLAHEVPYLISGGIGGLFLLGVGAMLWLSADLRDEWHKLDRIEQVLRQSDNTQASDEPSSTGPDTSRPVDDVGLAAAPGSGSNAEHDRQDGRAVVAGRGESR